MYFIKYVFCILLNTFLIHYSGKTSIMAPKDDIWELACSETTDYFSCSLVSQLSTEFVDIVRKLV